MVMQSNQVIYSGIEQGLIRIPSDFVIKKHGGYKIGIIISCGKFIISCKSRGPIKMQKNWLMKPGNQWEGREVCQVRDFVMSWPRRGSCHGIKLR